MIVRQETLIQPDANGWFETTLGGNPPSWPWALPHLHAVNLAPDPEEQALVDQSEPDATFVHRRGEDGDRTRWEVIGYWRGEFRVVEVHRERSRMAAGVRANRFFQSAPVRYLMSQGELIRESSDVAVTGEWPARFPKESVRDLSVLGAFVYERVRVEGAREAAEEFRSALFGVGGYTQSVLIRSYVRALTSGLDGLQGHLSPRLRHELEEAIQTARRWIGASDSGAA